MYKVKVECGGKREIHGVLLNGPINAIDLILVCPFCCSMVSMIALITVMENRARVQPRGNCGSL